MRSYTHSMTLLRRKVTLYFAIFLLLVTASIAMLTDSGQGIRSASALSNDSPYGFTTTAATFSKQAAVFMKDLKLTWVRTQIDLATIETKSGVYDWTLLDRSVALANSYGVNLVYPIRNAPSFHLTQTCKTTDGKNSK